MKRVASLDLLRGVAAFSVALPHYLTLNTTDWRGVDILAVTAVEIFFVLSGFVLANQILTQVVGKPARNLRVFLTRRWMRTIPPYLFALFCVSYVTGQLGTADFARYVFYVQNLFFQANANDYYPVAWSLSVEEWFYVTFAPLVFSIVWLCKSDARKTAISVAIFLILAVMIVRASFGDYHEWDAEVRRVVVFRIDSIVFGFLLYVAMEKMNGGGWASPSIRLLFLLFVLCVAAASATTYLTTTENFLSEQAFPYVAAAMGVSAVALAHKAEFLFMQRKILSAFSRYLGGISYSVYLFHIILVMLLKPKLQNFDLIWQLSIYLFCLVLGCSAFWVYFEKPILAARPRYRVQIVPTGQAALVSSGGAES
jgi:peptidoglycan/LPS O-acetylase OafA/YrhL